MKITPVRRVASGLLLGLLLPLSCAHASPPTRALIRGRQLHGYFLSLAKAGQTEITNVQRPKAGGALDTKIPGTGAQVDLTRCDQGGTPAVNLQQAVPATQTFAPGDSITVGWKTTIAHDNPPGVRIALRYVNTQGDTFANHVLGNGLQSGQTGGSRTVTLPTIQGRAELMWSWASNSDGGYYVSCADIQIGASTAGNNAGNTAGNTVGTDTIGGSPSAALSVDEEASLIVIIIGMCVIVAVVVSVGYISMSKNAPGAPALGGSGGNDNGSGESLPRPGLRGTPVPGLPAGWRAAVDGDGDTYYYTTDGRTSWVLPTSPA